MYLQGSTSIAVGFNRRCCSHSRQRRAPFKTVLTHGFMVDADREKISKTAGPVTKPQTAEAYVKKYGADVVGTTLGRVAQEFPQRHRRQRRTHQQGRRNVSWHPAMRCAINSRTSTTSDPAKYTIADTNSPAWTAGFSAEFAKIEADVIAAYDKCEFPRRFAEAQPVHRGGAVTRSITTSSKDRNTDAATSPRRRSTQTALYRLVTAESVYLRHRVHADKRGIHSRQTWRTPVHLD